MGYTIKIINNETKYLYEIDLDTVSYSTNNDLVKISKSGVYNVGYASKGVSFQLHGYKANCDFEEDYCKQMEYLTDEE
jgi:hypothetical protein